jgi:AbrB family looped-hinge helix DNA binding protein
MAEIEKTANQGLAEEPASFKLDLPKQEQRWRLTIGKDGRVVIPAAARAQMELGENGLVFARLKEGELHLVSPKVSTRKVQAIASKYKKPGESVVDEFIAERRAAAARGD